ncbi:pyrroline-5-carboxylate reductase [Roseimaritima sediminicola]|uniref:pyrroline-5-carboxylate reductase n=1 Tax=Roseimaritima sediminicola TaxID=2662066 RepID=UPI00129825D7|nr:pyrroline-5-carboxylate reductase [Roseimaritima sediminicola]
MNKIEGKLTLVGGGKMGRAMIEGMLAAGVIDAADVTVVDRNVNNRQWWGERLPEVSVTEEPAAAVENAQTVIIAVKPAGIADLARQCAGLWKGRLVISVAAGVQLKTLKEVLDSDCVVRVMPNTPCLVAAGASAYSCAQGVSKQQADTVAKIFGAIGVADQVDEKLLDAVTGVSGSGPAYVFVIIEALADGGVAAGLPRPLAQQLAVQTVLGAAKLVQETGEHPAALKDAVASPGGTTIAGLASLEQNGIRNAMIQAVQATAARSKALGLDT